jgi:sec-independent protein translocase protein TatA
MRKGNLRLRLQRDGYGRAAILSAAAWFRLPRRGKYGIDAVHLLRREHMLGGIGMSELMIILVIVLVIFGAGKLPEVGGALGKGIKNFKSAMTDNEKSSKADIEDKTKKDA